MKRTPRTIVAILAVGMALVGRSLHLCACDADVAHCGPVTQPGDECCTDDLACAGGGASSEAHRAPVIEVEDDCGGHGVQHAPAIEDDCGGHSVPASRSGVSSPHPTVGDPCSCPTVELPTSPAESFAPARPLAGLDELRVVDGQDVACASAWEPGRDLPARIARRSSFRPPGPLRRHLELSVLRC